MKRILLFIIFGFYFATIHGIKKEVNPKKVNVTEFMEVMQTCGNTLGFDRDYKLSLFDSKADFNKTLCLSFCALRKLNLYIVEDEIKKELMNVTSEEHLKLKEEIYKALDICQRHDPCRLFDCFFEYAKGIDGKTKSSPMLIKFFAEGRL